MILLAGPAATAETPSGEAVRVDSAERAAAELAAETVEILVLDCELSGAAELFERLREGKLGPANRPAVLLVADDPPDGLRSFDSVVEKPVADGAFEAAIEQATAVVAYRDAVETLYTECRTRAAEGTADPLAESPALESAREQADEALAALEEPEVVADLLDGDE